MASRYEVDNYIPSYSLIGRDMRLLIHDGNVTDAQIEDALAEPIPEVAWDQPPDLGAGGDEDGDGDLAYTQSSPFGGGDAGIDDDGFVSPYGGASCTASVAPGGGWVAALLIGLVGILRRR